MSPRKNDVITPVLGVREKLSFLADKIGKQVHVGKKYSSHEFKLSHIITADDDTPGYSSCFVLIKRVEDELWGFHVLHMNIDGHFGSASAPIRVRLGKYEFEKFGPQFLKTFELVLYRMSGIEHILGKMDILKQNTKWGKWLGKETVNTILYSVYQQMWDMDVEIAEFNAIPKDVLEEYRIIFHLEFGA